MFHVASHAWGYPALAHGGTLVVDRFRTETIFELLERHRVNGFGCVPSMLLMMLRHERRGEYDLTSVTNVRFGASPMPPDKLQDVRQLFSNASLYHGFGQTESGGTITVLPSSQAFIKAGGTGYPLPGCEIRIIDADGCDAPPGIAGEILAKGPNTMLEYFGKPEATAETLAEGWLHTGDIGYLDQDGCLFLVDRKKDMIIRGGENIYSVEIENVLRTNSDVIECAVIGVPDSIFGENVCAVVVADTQAREKLTLELLDLCRSQLARFKVPASIVFVSDLPKTSTGKIQKSVLKRQLAPQLEGPTK
jgi:long-chain acyl-CoA synthetase